LRTDIFHTQKKHKKDASHWLTTSKWIMAIMCHLHIQCVLCIHETDLCPKTTGNTNELWLYSAFNGTENAIAVLAMSDCQIQLRHRCS